MESVYPCHVNAPWMSICVFLSEWIFCMDIAMDVAMDIAMDIAWTLQRGC